MIYLLSDKTFDGVVSLPMLRIEYLRPSIEWAKYNNLIITSGHALEALQRSGDESWKSKNLFVVGEATAAKAREMGAKIYHVSRGYGEELAKEIIRQFPFGSYLYCRPRESAHDLAGMLRRSRIKADECIVYTSQCDEKAEKPAIASGAVVIFTSPKVVRCFLNHYEWDASWKAVCIGKTTARALPKTIPCQCPETPLLELAGLNDFKL